LNVHSGLAYRILQSTAPWRQIFRKIRYANRQVLEKVTCRERFDLKDSVVDGAMSTDYLGLVQTMRPLHSLTDMNAGI
jgi:hypothetical protein